MEENVMMNDDQQPQEGAVTPAEPMMAEQGEGAEESAAPMGEGMPSEEGSPEVAPVEGATEGEAAQM